MGQKLVNFIFAADEHPFTSGFHVHQGSRDLTDISWISIWFVGNTKMVNPYNGHKSMIKWHGSLLVIDFIRFWGELRPSWPHLDVETREIPKRRLPMGQDLHAEVDRSYENEGTCWSKSFAHGEIREEVGLVTVWEPMGDREDEKTGHLLCSVVSEQTDFPIMFGNIKEDLWHRAFIW